MHNGKALPQKTFAAYQAPRVAFPDLVAHQRDSFEWLVQEGLKELFKEFSPIPDYSGKKFELRFDGFELGEPKGDEEYARENMRTYEVPLKASVTLLNKTMGTEKSQDIFLADLPLMTDHGSFVVSGVERAIVPQLARSFGAFFISEDIKGKQFFGAKNTPNEFLSIEHIGMINSAGEIDTESEMVKQWTPAFENYTFKDVDGGTEVRVDMDIADQYESMFAEMWPQALAKLKEISER
jgi:DNA-directed RNA polymerase subunit beta